MVIFRSLVKEFLYLVCLIKPQQSFLARLIATKPMLHSFTYKLFYIVYYNTELKLSLNSAEVQLKAEYNCYSNRARFCHGHL